MLVTATKKRKDVYQLDHVPPDVRLTLFSPIYLTKERNKNDDKVFSNLCTFLGVYIRESI